MMPRTFEIPAELPKTRTDKVCEDIYPVVRTRTVGTRLVYVHIYVYGQYTKPTPAHTRDQTHGAPHLVNALTGTFPGLRIVQILY
jgi:hypothetical protein